MPVSFKILFYENGDPIDHRCIRRFTRAFSQSYQKVVETIIRNSATLKEESFRVNVATLLPSFKMTRKGIFHGVRVSSKGVDDPKGSKDYVIEKTSGLFVGLRKVKVETWKVGRVGASKILFATFPEIALPVDNREWDHVFKTEEYGKVLSTMVNEIEEWERRSKMSLDNVDSKQTLPSIYNVMAMAARRL